MLSDEKKEKLSLILEKGSSNYNITIIVAEQCKKLSEYSFENGIRLMLRQIRSYGLEVESQSSI